MYFFCGIVIQFAEEEWVGSGATVTAVWEAVSTFEFEFFNKTSVVLWRQKQVFFNPDVIFS